MLWELIFRQKVYSILYSISYSILYSMFLIATLEMSLHKFFSFSNIQSNVYIFRNAKVFLKSTVRMCPKIFIPLNLRKNVKRFINKDVTKFPNKVRNHWKGIVFDKYSNCPMLYLCNLRWNLKNLSRGLNLPKPGLN